MFDRLTIARQAVFAPLPPSRKRPPIRKLELVAGARPELFWFLNDQVLGVLVHFDPAENRTYPCTGEQCWSDHALGLPRWQGWISVLNYRSRQIQMLACTPGLVEMVPDLVHPTAKLRGRFFEAWRRGKSQHGKVFGRFPEVELPAEGLPKAPDVRVELERLWTAERKDEC